jgi:hypothetical protein
MAVFCYVLKRWTLAFFKNRVKNVDFAKARIHPEEGHRAICRDGFPPSRERHTYFSLLLEQ